MILNKGSLIHGYLAEKPFSNITAPIFEIFFGVYDFVYAPLIFERNNNNYYNILKEILSYLKGEFKDCYPPIHSNIDQEKIKYIFIKHGFKYKPWATFLVYLNRSLDELWKNLKKNSRYSVRKCKKQGVYVKEVENIKELSEYYSMLKETCDRNAISCKSFKNIRIMYELGKKYNISKYFIAYTDDIPLAGYGLSYFNRIIFQGGLCRSNYSIKKKIYAGDYLQWHAIKFGKEIGARIYDLTGVNPNPRDKKEKGIYMFKSRWGGVQKNFYIYSRYNPNKLEFLKKVERLIK